MKIAKLEAWPVRLPRDMASATGTAGSPTALASGEGAYRWSSVYPALYSINFETALIRVTLDNGLVGWGEAQAPLAPEVACEIVRLLLTAAIEGQAFDGSRPTIERLWDRMFSSMRVRGQSGGFMLDAIAGVDMALWDLAGKIQRKPVCALLCDQPKTKVPAYVSGLPAGARAETAARYMDEGLRKFKLFFDTSEPEFFAAWDELPPVAEVAVDALWRLTPESAPAFAARLDQRNALWLEAPLLPEDPAAHADLAKQCRTPIAIGESYRTRWELSPFFRQRAMQVLQPDLGRCGITEGMRLASLAAQWGCTVVPHVSIAMGPQIAAALHYSAAVEQCRLCEYNPQVLAVANRFLCDPLQIEGSHYRIPQTPGLGIEMDMAALDRVTYQRP